MLRYVIGFTEKEEKIERHYYWTCRFKGTDNYSTNASEGALFVDKSAAHAMIATLNQNDHFVHRVYIPTYIDEPRP